MVLEVFMTGHGPSKTGATGTMRVSCNWDIRGVASLLGESTSGIRLGWCLLQQFLFSRPRWVYCHAEVCGVVVDILPLHTDRFRSASRPTNELDECAYQQEA